MKQFSRCKNCQQWYVHTFTTIVEVCQGDRQRRQLVWCLRCIAEAEKRSWTEETQTPVEEPATLLDSALMLHADVDLPESHEALQQLLSEHAHLMDQALHAEEAILLPRIKHFLEKCQRYQEHLDIPEHAQRLAGHQQYWEAFLKVLK